MGSFICPFPWTSPCVTTGGRFRVCPVSQSAADRGVVRADDGTSPRLSETLMPAQVMNHESLRSLRERMLTGGDVSATCSRCLSEEAHGLKSRRLLEMEHFPDFNADFVGRWTERDGRLREGAPVRLVILRLGNKCNLVCRMCGPDSSSAWYEEWRATRHAGFHVEDERVFLRQGPGGRPQAQPDLFAWTEERAAQNFIAACGATLERLHFSGGEPLLSKAHLPILRALVDQGRAGAIALEYNSNMSVLPEEVLELWRHFRFVEIGISVDGPPRVNEYIRHPLRTEVLLKNLRRLDASAVPGRFWISTTVQIYNLIYLDELTDWLRAQNFARILPRISWHVLRGPRELSIFALPEPAKQNLKKRLADSVEFHPLADLLMAEDASELMGDFWKLTETMDLYRGQSLRAVLPELWACLGGER